MCVCVQHVYTAGVMTRSSYLLLCRVSEGVHPNPKAFLPYAHRTVLKLTASVDATNQKMLTHTTAEVPKQNAVKKP